MEVIIASLYNYVYLLVVAIITWRYLPIYLTQSSLNDFNDRSKSDNAFILLIFMILFIGFRPVVEIYFQDMAAYSYKLRRYADADFEFNWDAENKIFDNFLVWFASNRFDQRIFFIIMSILYFVPMYYGLKRIFPDDEKLAFLTYLAGLSTFSYAVNGIKAGVAASIFILALSFRDKKLLCVLLMLISLGFHHSMTLPIAACIIVYFIRNPKLYYCIWALSLIMCILHISYFQELFSGFTDDQGARYLNATFETTTAHIGFRPDFILYSSVPVILGYKFELESEYKLSWTYQFLMHFYLLTNAVWMLCMYASFNNRIAYLSWFVYPIVIIAPFLDKMNIDPDRYFKVDKVVKYHLLFTLIMIVVYWGILGLGN